MFRDAKDDVRQACRLHHDHGGGSAEVVNSTSKLIAKVDVRQIKCCDHTTRHANCWTRDYPSNI